MSFKELFLYSSKFSLKFSVLLLLVLGWYRGQGFSWKVEHCQPFKICNSFMILFPFLSPLLHYFYYCVHRIKTNNWKESGTRMLKLVCGTTRWSEKCNCLAGDFPSLQIQQLRAARTSTAGRHWGLATYTCAEGRNRAGDIWETLTLFAFWSSLISPLL